MESAERIADELPSLRGEPGYLSICFEHAVPKRDLNELKRLLDLATYSPERGSAEPGRIARALRICIQQLSGERLDPRATSIELTGHHVVHGESGNLADLETAIAASIFIEAREPDLARQAVVNYLRTYRRGRTVICAMLRDIICLLDIRELPLWCRIYQAGSQSLGSAEVLPQ
jgi:hypothetical protein